MPGQHRRRQHEIEQTVVTESVKTDEHNQLRIRREVCFPDQKQLVDHDRSPPSQNCDCACHQEPDGTGTEACRCEKDGSCKCKCQYEDTVGLALSGGGIRSASFNLGLLQVFQKKGLLRWVDYLSTVSGGGFIGSYFSTSLCQHKEDPCGHEPAGPPLREFELNPKAGRIGQHQAGEFVRGGSYLKDDWRLADRFTIGFILNLIVWASLLVFLTATVAAVWRCLDCPWMVLWVQDLIPHWLPYRDWSRPFVPAFFVFLFWLGGWAYTYCFHYSQRFVFPKRWMSFAFLIVSIFIGLAVFLSTDQITLTGLPGASKSTHDGFPGFRLALVAVLFISILPFVNPVKLLRSEPRSPGKFERSILNVAGTVLLCLAPFSLIFAFSHEGISGFATNRPPHLTGVDISRPFEFLAAVSKEAEVTADGEKGLSSQLHELIWDPGTGLLAHTISDTSEQGTVKRLTQGFPALANEIPTGKTLIEVLSNDDFTRNAIQRVVEPSLHEKLEAIHDKDSTDTAELASIADLIQKGQDGSGTQKRLRTQQRRLRHIVSVFLADIINTEFIDKDIPIQYALGLHREHIEADGAGDGQTRWEVMLEGIRPLHDSSDFFDELWPLAILTSGQLNDSDSRRLNRIILDGRYQHARIHERTTSRVLLNWREDQNTRWLWAGGSLIVFLLSGYLVNMNATSMHGFYRQKIHESFVVGSNADAPGFDSTSHVAPCSIHQLNTVEKGGPYHIFCATLNIFNNAPWAMNEYSSAYTFMFSPRWCGAQPLANPDTERQGYVRTRDYCDGQIDVATAAALSGAAFSPTVFHSPLLFFTSMLLNLRLGQWLPNPARCAQRGGRESKLAAKRRQMEARRKVSPLAILKDIGRTLKGGTPLDWDYCFLTDGGHNDNLGIGPLMFRRCRLIIISDATGDPEYRFEDFLKAFRRYRVRAFMGFSSVELPQSESASAGSAAKAKSKDLDLSPLRPKEVADTYELASDMKRWINGTKEKGEWSFRRNERDIPAQSDRHFLLMRLEYPEPADPQDPDGPRKEGWLLYIKSTMTGDEPADLKQWQIDNPSFPHDPTTDQFFTENQFESYRQLGEHIGKEICEMIVDEVKLGESKQVDESGEQSEAPIPPGERRNDEGHDLRKVIEDTLRHEENEEVVRTVQETLGEWNETDSNTLTGEQIQKLTSIVDQRSDQPGWKPLCDALKTELANLTENRSEDRAQQRSEEDLWDWNKPASELIKKMCRGYYRRYREQKVATANVVENQELPTADHEQKTESDSSAEVSVAVVCGNESSPGYQAGDFDKGDPQKKPR